MKLNRKNFRTIMYMYKDGEWYRFKGFNNLQYAEKYCEYLNRKFGDQGLVYKLGLRKPNKGITK